jgi:hypothetical protein
VKLPIRPCELPARRVFRDLRLNMMNTEPVYRFRIERQRRTISAVDGRLDHGIPSQLALAIARVPPRWMLTIDTVDRDQWSVTARYDPSRPLYLICQRS